MKNIFPAIKLTVLCLIFFSTLYTLAILSIAQLSPNKGKGETIEVNGKTVGFKKSDNLLQRINISGEGHLPLITMQRVLAEAIKVLPIQPI